MSKSDRQRSSEVLPTPQGELYLVRPHVPQPVNISIIQSQKDMLAAFNLAANVCGLEDKEIYIPLKIDAGHWSRMRHGDAHFPLNQLNPFCDLVGNEVLLEYWAWTRGRGLHQLETETEKQLRLERERNLDLAKENALLRGLITKT